MYSSNGTPSKGVSGAIGTGESGIGVIGAGGVSELKLNSQTTTTTRATAPATTPIQSKILL